jgi:hypothetical protein
MNLRGIGDRWLAGEAIPGVSFALHDAVEITDGEDAGARGAIMLLMMVRPEPKYLVRLRDGSGDVRVLQSKMRRLE